MNEERDVGDLRRRLEKSFKKGRGIKHAIDTAYKLFGNPFVMFDTSYTLLAYTENTVTDDPIWNEFVKYGTFTHKTVHFFGTQHFLEDAAKTDVVALLSTPMLKYDRISGKLFDKDDVHVANITVVACYRPFRQDDFSLIETVCEFLSAELQASEFYQKIDRVFQENIISQLIEEQVAPSAPTEEKIGELYAATKNDLYLGVVDISQYDPSLTHIGYFRDLFRKMQDDIKYYIYLNNIVMVISTDDKLLNCRKDLSVLNTFFKEYDIYAGISGAFQNLFELPKYYRQALNALNIGMSLQISERIFTHDDYCVISFLNALSGSDADLSKACNPVLAVIKEHDGQNGTVFFETLRTYLENGMNRNLTAEKMHIAPIELDRQLDEISEQFGMDWNNGHVLFGIYLSIWIAVHISR